MLLLYQCFKDFCSHLHAYFQILFTKPSTSYLISLYLLHPHTLPHRSHPRPLLFHQVDYCTMNNADPENENGLAKKGDYRYLGNCVHLILLDVYSPKTCENFFLNCGSLDTWLKCHYEVWSYKKKKHKKIKAYRKSV